MEMTNENETSLPASRLALANILDNNEEILEPMDAEEGAAVATDDEELQQQHKTALDGYCVECDDQPALVFCEQCQDDFCEVCFQSQHRKGSRKRHRTRKLVKNAASMLQQQQEMSATSLSKKTVGDVGDNIHGQDHDNDDGENQNNITALPLMSMPKSGTFSSSYYLDRSKFIPLRLELSERKYLRLLEAALNVSEYTDRIDILSHLNKPKRIVHQIKELCSILSGLVLAADYKIGQELFKNKNFEDNAEFFQDLFELGRRHKIMNPDKMRDTYGKLLYMLQDSQMSEVQELLSFKCVKPLKTVYSVLSQASCLAIFDDELIVAATSEIVASPGKSRYDIQTEIKKKERAIEILSRRYAKPDINSDLIKQCLYSIGDNHAFLRTNRDPCDQMIAYLKHYFVADRPEPEFSLAIYCGKGGARLSHDHNKQYNYVLQSLSLWREIQHEMFQLWCLAEQDLLSSDNMYRLRDTGQGLNRVQAAPKVSRLMQMILNRAQQKVGYWVGSSVVHLGDHNVPNALMFIDKYTQVYRILLPVTTAIEKLEEVYKDNGIRKYIDSSFGGIETAKKVILCDFFKYAFDGSGADNFFDAGSCIDGRLTSAWNWCSKLEKKLYFPLFLLTGFVGFDGHF